MIAFSKKFTSGLKNEDMVKVRTTGKYKRSLEELLFENPDLQITIKQSIYRFQLNPLGTRLSNHPLTRRLEGKWAFSVTGDIRIVYEWIGKSTIRFLEIGPHIKVYSKPKEK